MKLKLLLPFTYLVSQIASIWFPIFLSFFLSTPRKTGGELPSEINLAIPHAAPTNYPFWRKNWFPQLLHILPAHGPQLSAFSTDRLPLLNSHPFPTTASHLKTDQEGADIKAWHSLPTSDNIEVHRAIQLYKGFPGAWAVMNPLALQETWVWSLGQEDGIPLQHLWIGNPMKWRAWLAAVHGVAKELDTT